MALADFEITAGRLTALVNLEYDLDYSFADRCDELLACPETELVIDLSAVSYINSAYVGIIAVTNVQAQEMGKTLKVFAPPQIATYIRILFSGCMEISVPESTAE